MSMATVGVCILALPLCAFLQSRPATRLRGWIVLWSLLLARYVLLSLDPRLASASQYAGVCAAAAGVALLEISQTFAVLPPWVRWSGWFLGLAACVDTLAPAPWHRAAPWLVAALLLGVLTALLRNHDWPARGVAAATLLWTAAVLPHFPGDSALTALVPVGFGWSMLWLALQAPASADFLVPAPSAAAPEQEQLFRQSVRRSREFEILTHIGTALSSALEADALLQTIHTQLRKLMDVRNFYVAFLDRERDEIRFAFEVEDGRRLPARARPRGNALTEHVIATGQPLLISHDLVGFLRQRGLTLSGRPAKNYLAVPVVLQGQPCGVIAVQNHEREDAFDTEHQHVLEILASQAGVALDNVRLFAAVQRDAGQKAFLNHIARLTISTLSPSEMLNTVVEETAKAFRYDHISVGLLRAANDVPTDMEQGPYLEIAASAGVHPAPDPQSRVPLGRGLAGRAAETGEPQAWSASTPAAPGADARLLAGCPAARSGLALPVRYAGQLLAVLHLESHADNGFAPDQVEVLQTLADQLAVALNHASMFQRMQHQAITDSLTGLKTRRFFMEALQGEWARARAVEADGGAATFAVVLVDLDEFKPLNDRFGHLEGDRALVRVARVLEHKCRASSVVARFGGDEFIILVPACPPEAARLLPARLEAGLADDPVLAQRGLRASFGLALYPDSGRSVEDLLHFADADMYRTKQTRQHRGAPRR